MDHKRKAAFDREPKRSRSQESTTDILYSDREPITNRLITKFVFQKLNVVFDLDMTLIHAVKTTHLQSKYSSYAQEIIIQLHNGTYQKYYVSLRVGCYEMLEKLSPIANFYIRSNSEMAYTTAIVKNVINKYKQYIPLENVFSFIPLNQSKEHNETKDLELMGLGTFNTIIVDDQIIVWKKKYRQNVIVSLKFAPLLLDNALQGNSVLSLWIDGKSFTYDEWSIFEGCDQTSQLSNISSFIFKCFIEFNHEHKSVANIMRKERRSILRGQKFYIGCDPNKNEMISALIRELGGHISVFPENALHIALPKEKSEEDPVKKYSMDYLLFSYIYIAKLNIEGFCYEAK